MIKDNLINVVQSMPANDHPDGTFAGVWHGRNVRWEAAGKMFEAVTAGKGGIVVPVRCKVIVKDGSFSVEMK